MKRACSTPDLSLGRKGPTFQRWSEEELLGHAPVTPSPRGNTGAVDVHLSPNPSTVAKVPYISFDEPIGQLLCKIREGRDLESAGDHSSLSSTPNTKQPVSQPISPVTSDHLEEELLRAVDESEDCDPPAAEPEKKSPAKEESPAQHPWAQFYEGGPGAHIARNTSGECETDRLVRLLTRHYSLTDAMQFRAMALEQADTPPKEDCTAPREPLEHTTCIPESPFAPYQIIERLGRTLVAASLFTEVFAPDRADLRLARLTHASRLLNSTETDAVNIETSLLLPGDILLVTKLVSNPKRTINPAEYTMKDVCWITDTPAYTVAEFRILPRKTVQNVYIQPVTIRKMYAVCLVEGSRVLSKVHCKWLPGRKCANKPYVGSAFIPYDHTDVLLGTAKNHYELNVEMLPIAPLPHPLGSVYGVRNLEPSVEEQFAGVLHHHRCPNDNGKLFRMAAFAAESVHVLANANHDRRTYIATMKQITPLTDGTKTAVLEVNYGHHPPSQKAWASAKDGTLQYKDQEFAVNIIGATFFTEPKGMHIRIKINRQQSLRLPSAVTDIEERLRVLIRQTLDESFRPVLHALHRPPEPRSSRGEAILAAVFGGPPIPLQPASGECPIPANGLSADQRKFAECLLNTETLAVVAESGFGSGKSTTMLVTADHLRSNKTVVLLLATTNAAATNICSIAKTRKIGGLARLITATNRRNLETGLLTDVDVPVLMDKLILEVIAEEHPLRGLTDKELLKEYEHLLSYGVRIGLVTAADILRCPSVIRSRLRTGRPAKFMSAAGAYLRIAEPQILAATIDTALSFYTSALESRKVSMVMIDEASQVPVATFIAVAGTFLDARISLIGDRRQLPPLKPEGARGIVARLGCLSVLEIIHIDKSMPSCPFWDIYRCPEDITSTLSDLFYNGVLRSKKTYDHERLQLPPSIWSPAPRLSSLRFVEPGGTQELVGTSFTNTAEVEYIVAALKELENLNATPSVAVLTFYRAQLLAILARIDQESLTITPFIGTVDQSQGREFDVVFVATTRTSGTGTCFVGDEKRVNVAISRTKDKCIVTGCVAVLRQSRRWKQLMNAAEQRK